MPTSTITAPVPGLVISGTNQNSNHQNISAPSTITHTLAQNSPVVFGSVLSTATVGVVYTESLSVSGGIPPYTFSNISGLPPGLTLSSGGVLSGTPTTAGSYTFVITVVDSNGNSDSQTLTIVVSPIPAVGGNYGFVS